MLFYLYLPVGCWTDDLQKSLSVPAILWFCDFLTSPNNFWGHLDSWEAGEERIASASPISLCSRTGGFEEKYEMFHPKNRCSLCVSESPLP